MKRSGHGRSRWPWAVGTALAGLALGLAQLGPSLGAAPRGVATAEAGTAALPSARLGPGWVVWESNRGGAYRIWILPLSGGVPRQLSRDENGRDHCCAHLSPDGERVAYLSLPAHARKYTPPTTIGRLHLVGTDGSLDHVIAAAARHYGEHRAALWWSDDELAFIDGEGDSRLLDLSMGVTRRLSRGPRQGEGYLVAPGGRWATSSTAHFSPRDPATGEVRPATPLGGCQAWIAPGGDVGLWTAGAGGPIDAIDLATRRTWTVLAKHDPRLPRGRGYLYFPMLSRDRTLLALAASADEHDHFRADYDVFLQPLDPATLAARGDAVRVTAHPAVDRYPDVWRENSSPPPLAAPPPAKPIQLASSWPAAREGLALLWQGADRSNRAAPDAASEQLVLSGEAWSDRRGRLALAGGGAEFPAARAVEVASALREANAVTLEMMVEPIAGRSPDGGVLLALGSGPRQRGLWIGRSGSELELRIRTGETGPAGGDPARVRLPPGGPHHVAFTYSPGRLRLYVDGRRTAEPAWAGDFYPWRVRRFALGFEPGNERSFRGWISHLAVFARELSAEEVAAEARLALADLSTAAPVPRLEVEATLVARSPLPTVEEISPYRQALATETWRVERILAGSAAGGEIRVARWALLDGRLAASTRLRAGDRARLRLEPFADQRQLESLYLSDEPPTTELLWADVGIEERR